MPPLKLNQFGGMLPAWDDTLLPEDQAAASRDAYLYSGALIGWRRPKPLHRLVNPAANYVFRIPSQTQAIASAHLIFVDNPSEGDAVTVGEETYTFTATVTHSYDVLIGPDATTSAENLIGALTLNGVFNQQFGQGTCINPAITGNSPWVGLPFSITNAFDTPGADTLFLIPVEPSGTMKTIDVAVMPVTTDPTAKFTGVIYNNSLGIPGSLIAVGTEVIGCVAFKPIISTLATEPYLQAGNTYWIGFMTDSAVTMALADSGANGSKAAHTYSDGPPPVAPTMSPLLVDWQIWTDMQTIATTDPINTLGVTANLPGDPFPEIIVQAPDFGAAYNATRVGSNTDDLVWLTDDVSLSHTTTTLQGGSNQTQDDSITSPSAWMEFVDPDTNVVRTPVVDDTFQRYYIASPSQPPMYNTYDRIQNGDPPFLLGVPTPGCTPNLSVSGGGDASTVGLAAANSINTGALTGDNLYLVPIFPTGAMSLNDVSMTPAQALPTARFTAVIYSDNLGEPGTFIAQGAEFVGTTPGQTLSSVFTVPVGLNSGIQYWIGFIIDTSQAIMLSDDLGNANARTGPATYNDGPPVHAPTTTVGPDWQIWGDVTTDAVLETRSYVYTWVTAYGEEGPPSPPVTETGWSNSTWTIGLFTPSPDEMGVTRNITRTRLYRTVSGQQTTTFFFVAEFDVNTANYVDLSDDSVVAANFQLASTNWSGPPEGLVGIARMANGIMAGFKGNELWFSEAYQPHAWPAGYVITTDFPIVGIGVTGTAVVACTTSQPAVAYGVNPASLTSVKVPITEPCISRGSIVNTDVSVIYASPNGLVKISAYGQGNNFTQNWIRRESWQRLTPQRAVRAVRHLSSYFAFGSIVGTDHSLAQEGYTVELDSTDAQSFTIWPQAGGHRIGFSELTAPNLLDIRNVEIDPWSGVCLLVEDDGNVYYYDFTDPAPAIVSFKWRSKQYQHGAKENWSAFRVFFNVPPGTPPQNPVRTTVPDMGDDIAFQVGMYGVVRVFSDSNNDGIMNLITARELRQSGELMRINSGFKSEFWQFEIEGVISVQNLQAGATVKDLRQV